MSDHSGTMPGRTAWALVASMALMIATFERLAPNLIADDLKSTFGLSDLQLGLLSGSAFTALYATMALPLAILADRWNRAWVLSLSLVLLGLAAIGLSMSETFLQLIGCRLLMGIGAAGTLAPALALSGRATRSWPGGGAFLIGIVLAGVPAASALGTFLALGGAFEGSWRTLLQVSGLGCIALGVVLRLVSRDRRTSDEKQIPKVREEPSVLGFLVKVLTSFLPEDLKTAVEQTTDPIERMGRVRRLPIFWLLAGAATVLSLASSGLIPVLQSVLARAESHHLVAVTSAWSASAAVFAALVSGLLAGWAYTSTERRRLSRLALVAAFAGVLGLLATILVLLEPTMATLTAALVLATAGASVWITPIIMAVQTLVTEAQRTRATAALVFMATVAGSLNGFSLSRLFYNPLAGGPDAFNPAPAALFNAGLYVLGSALLFIIFRTVERPAARD